MFHGLSNPHISVDLSPYTNIYSRAEGNMLIRNTAVAVAALTLFSSGSQAFVPASRSFASRHAFSLASTTEEETTKNENVLQTEDTSRDKIMTFSYDMSLEPKYEKPTYPGTGNGLSGDAGEYDVIVIGSGMGGLSCGAISAKYGDKVLVLESHIKCGGSAHTFSRMHNGEKYSFEVGPSIFEGLDRPSLNPLRMIFDMLGEQMPVKTYTGLGYWTPTGYWRFPIGSKQKFEDLLLEQAEDGPKAVKVCRLRCFNPHVAHYNHRLTRKTRIESSTGMECFASSTENARRIHDCGVVAKSTSRCWISCYYGWKSSFRCHPS